MRNRQTITKGEYDNMNMNNPLAIISNQDFGNVRTITDPDGTVYFCGKDVASALGYALPRKAIYDHCKGAVKRNGVVLTTNQYGKTTRQTVAMSFIPEGDVYRLIIHSKLPAAQKFESWLFDEVIPTIIRTGSYPAPKQPQLSYAEALRILADEIAEIQANRQPQLC